MERRQAYDICVDGLESEGADRCASVLWGDGGERALRRLEWEKWVRVQKSRVARW